MAMSVVYSNFCGMVVSENRGGVISDYVHDTLGSTIGLMDSAGTMTDRWEYWPFGEVLSRTGTNATPLTFLGVLRYFQDVLSTLYYVRARHLRADLARWLTVDPLWPEEPLFAYARSSPATVSDFSGLATACTTCPCVKQEPGVLGYPLCCGQKHWQCRPCTFYSAGTDVRVVQCSQAHESAHCAQLYSGACGSR